MYCANHGICEHRLMSPATAHDNYSWADPETFVRIRAFDCLCVPVRDLQRSIGFYSELFAMRVVAGGAQSGRVVLSREGRVRLALYQHAATSSLPAIRIAAKVDSLEAAREMIWDLGIPTLGDYVHPQDAKSMRDRDAFVIADPDGHEIRFIE